MSSIFKKKLDGEPEEADSDFELTTELIMVQALKSGLTLADFEIMTVGMIIDYIDEYVNLMSVASDIPTVRQATQADFDNF